MERLRNMSSRALRYFRFSDGSNGRVVRGSAVVLGGRFVLKAIYFVRTIILARLLFPSDFGLFALASLSLGFVTSFFASGLNTSLVQTKDDPVPYLNSVWTVGIIRNTLLALLVCATAPYAGQFFGNPEIVPMIYVLSFSIFIVAFENIGMVLLQKELRFGRRFVYDAVVVMLEVATVIIAAWVLESAWALVIGALANRIFGVVLTYFFHPYRPWFTVDLSPAWKLFGYGKWISVAAIASFLISQGDNMVVGKLLSTDELGYYQLAFALAFIPALEFARALGNVLFPFFAKIQGDRVALIRTFTKLSRMIFIVVTPMSFGLLALGNPIVNIFYGERWLPMVPLVNILLVYGFLRTFEFTLNPLFMGAGKPKVTFAAQVAQLFGMFACIVPLTLMYGSVGTAWSVVVGGLASIATLVYFARQQFALKMNTYIEVLGIALASSAGMFAALHWIQNHVSIDSSMWFLSAIMFGAIVYVAFVLLLDRCFGKQVVESVKWIVINLRS